MYDRVAWKIVLIVLVIAACVYFAYPPGEKLILAPDLAGGTLLELSVSDPSARDSVVDVLKKRQDSTGMKGLQIVAVGTRNIQIIAPSGNSDDVEAILKQSVLEFKIEAPKDAVKAYGDQLAAANITDYTKGLPEPIDSNYTAYVLIREGKDGVKSVDWILVESAAKLKGSDFAKFDTAEDENRRPAVGFRLETSAAQEFGELTARLHEEGRRLAIILDGKCISAPEVNEDIRGGNGIISMGGGDNAEIQKQRVARFDTVVAPRLGVRPVGIVSRRDDRFKCQTLGAA